MNRHFDDMTLKHRGREPQMKTIALCEADTRALGMEDIV